MPRVIDAWDIFLKNTGTGPTPGVAPTGTAIYQSWLTAFNANKYYGVPLVQEYKTQDSNGASITAQDFSAARAEYDGTTVRWYNTAGLIV